jgi:2-dehydro-3-deoxygalactonokinase
VSRLLAVDWGSSSLRGALLDADGGALEERSFPRGILTVEAGGFPAVFAAASATG